MLVVTQYVQTLADEPVLTVVVTVRQLLNLAPVTREVYVYIPREVLRANHTEVETKLDTGIAYRTDVGRDARLTRLYGNR